MEKTRKIAIACMAFAWMFLACAMPEGMAQVNIVNGNNQIRIDYTMPRYVLVESEVNAVIGGSGIRFEGFQVDDGKYGVVADDGKPQLPQRTLFLSVPGNAANFRIRMESVVNGTRSLPSGTYVEPYMDTDPENPVWTFDEAYYAYSDTSYLPRFFEMEECFTMMGERILPVTLLPFRYIPKEGRIEELRSATFVITWDLQGTAETKKARSRLQENYLASMVDNYDAAKSGPVLDILRYLIVTAPEFADEMAFFKEYKENLGYRVSLVTTDQTGKDAASIREYIKNADPDFVLLVGDISRIPHASGNPDPGAENDPMTDQGYRRFSDNKWSYGDVFLGRWPVSTESDVSNMIHKTIYMETRLHAMPKTAYFLAGQENNSYMTWQFKRGLNYAEEEGFSGMGYVVKKYYQRTVSEIENVLRTYSQWFVYSGHGSVNHMAYFSDNGIPYILPRNFNLSTIYPLVWSFSCRTGNFANVVNGYTTFVKGIMCPYAMQSQGAISMFGSSVNVYSNASTAIVKKVMGDAFGELHLGQMVTKGMGYYACRMWSKLNRKRTFRYLKSFNLMGDPSFLKDGDLGVVSQYSFSEKIVASFPMDLELEASNRIAAMGGLMLHNANLSFSAGNAVSLDGAIATTGTGQLEIEAGSEVELGATTHIQQGSTVGITAGNEIVLLPGCKIDAGTNVTLQVTGK